MVYKMYQPIKPTKFYKLDQIGYQNYKYPRPDHLVYNYPPNRTRMPLSFLQEQDRCIEKIYLEK